MYEIIHTTKMRTLHIICLHILLSTVVAVYDDKHMDVINPDIYKPKNNSYFGYSIGYFNEDLYISAPAGDDKSQIYKYSISSMALYETMLYVKPVMRIPKKYKFHNWFGATIKKGSSFLIICAPRAPFMYGTNTVTTGMCVKILQDSSLPVMELPPLLKYNLKEFNNGIDSYGWSVEVDKFDQVLVGGPAIVKDKNSGLKIHYNDITEPTLAGIKEKLNLGYSIASGCFLSNTSVTYAVSTTYGEHGEGEVLFFNEILALVEKLDSGEVGSMYGAALASAYLTGARSSLLVGAPTWAGSGYNTGAVFVYVPVNETKLVLKRILKGTASGGQFGNSIANIGDLDADKIDDFAIGAPYEGKGVVYIYTGFGILSGKTWWRKIQPETFNSFGFSLVPVPSIHGMGCNNLGIGAPLSNRAFILKCLPVTTIQLYTVHPDLKLRSNFSYYEFDVCLNITYPLDDIILQIQINVDVSHSAAKLEKNKGETIMLLKRPLQKFCEKYAIFTPIEGNYDEHVKLDISVTLKSSSAKTFPPVLSDRSVTSLKESLWIANCVLQYGRCIPKLEVKMTSELTVPYKVGLRNTENFNLTITNAGESAYNACAVVSVGSASIRSTPSECSHNVTGKQVICRPSRWIPRGDTWDINEIEIEINSVTNKDRNIVIHYDVYGHCGDDGEKQSKDYMYPLVLSFNNIDVLGLSSSGKVVNVTDQDVRNGKYFQHAYTISNNGPVDLIDVTCGIVLLKKSYLQYSTPKMTQQKDNIDTLSEPCAINKETESEDFVRMVCNISMLPRNSETSIVVPLHILPNNFGAIRTENGTVFTSIDLQIPSNDNRTYNKNISTTTTLLLETTFIPTWVWIISILIALFLLVIVILILREYNCFQRKNKKNLEELRKSVRRRSTHRNLSRTSDHCKEN